MREPPAIAGESKRLISTPNHRKLCYGGRRAYNICSRQHWARNKHDAELGLACWCENRNGGRTSSTGATLISADCAAAGFVCCNSGQKAKARVQVNCQTHQCPQPTPYTHPANSPAPPPLFPLISHTVSHTVLCPSCSAANQVAAGVNVARLLSSRCADSGLPSSSTSDYPPPRLPPHR